MTDAELVAYNLGARSARAARLDVLLAAQGGTRPHWRMTEEELRLTATMPADRLAHWIIRGWREETSRLAEADLPTEEEE